MKKPDYYVASDYAGLTFEGGSFYYGYEETMGEDEEWCFVAKIDGLPEIKIPSSKLAGIKDQDECAINLAIGIGWVLTKYKLLGWG